MPQRLPSGSSGKGEGTECGRSVQRLHQRLFTFMPRPCSENGRSVLGTSCFCTPATTCSCWDPRGLLCHPQKATGQGKPTQRRHRRGSRATSGQYEPRGTLQAHCGKPGSGRGCPHFRAPGGGLSTLFSAECALWPHHTECGCLARAHPHTAAPLCRPWLPAAVLGPGGCGCRQLSFWQLLWLPRTSPWEASPNAMCLGAGFRSRTGWSGPQHPKLQGGQSADPPPVLASLPSPLPQLCLPLCQAFCSCRGCIPRWALVPPRHSSPLGWAWQAAGRASER